MNREIKKFSPRIIRFVLPYVLICLFTVVVFYKCGEIFWFNKTFDAQVKERRNFIHGAAYSNMPHWFRLYAVEVISPKILVLGASRVLQFRSVFFKDSIPVYSTGGVFTRLQQLRAFLESIPEENLPRVIILGVDQWWFNARYDSSVKIKNDLIYNQYSWADNWNGMENWQQFYYDWLQGKIKWKKLWPENHSGTEWFGISARMGERGFRRDGSRSYGEYLNDSINKLVKIQNSLDEAMDNAGLFLWSNSIDKNAIDELRVLLQFCKKHKITVTAFLPSIHGRLWNEMKKHSEDFPVFYHLYETIYPVFRENSFRIFDFSHPETFGSSDDEMIDAIHGGEKSTLKLYLRLLRKDPYLNQYSDSTYLKTKLDSTKGNFDVFGNY